MFVSSHLKSYPWLMTISAGVGVVSALAFQPYALWPLYFVLPAFWYLAATELSGARAATALWIASTVHYAIGTHWIAVGMTSVGGVTALGAGITWLLISVIIGAEIALFGLILRAPCPRALRPALAALAWAWNEYVRESAIEGFPWLNMADALVDSPLLGWLPILGGTMTGALLVLLQTACIEGFREKNWRSAVVGGKRLTACAVVLGAGQWAGHYTTAPSSQSALVGALHTSRPSREGWSSRLVNEQIERLTASSAAALRPGLKLLVWPETAIPVPSDRIEPFLERSRQVLSQNNTTLVFGSNELVRSGATTTEFNAAQAVNPRGTYFKRKLVPVGEYQPFPMLNPLLKRPTGESFDSFTAGPAAQPLLQTAAGPALVALCYEVAFAQVLLNTKDATSAKLLLVLTNDDWFAKTSMPEQHDAVVRLRARELGLPTIHATNGGITSIINSNGAPLASISGAISKVVTADIRLPDKLSPFARSGGTWHYLIICTLVVVFLGVVTSILTRPPRFFKRRRDSAP